MKEAILYKKEDDNVLTCYLCPHHCRIADGQRGLCGVRENRGGTLYSLVYGKAIALNVDPIEKKPLFHFLPGSRALSIATAGCNMTCLHCQNADISQAPRSTGRIPGQEVSPEEVVSRALETGSRTIAYTYTEPTIFMEYALDIARPAKQEGIKNIFVTNGYMSPPARGKIGPLLDGANIDLKSFRDEFYRKICGARLQPVLDTIIGMKEMGIWVEVTTLVIPGYNDSDDELASIAGFLADLSEDIPWHVSAFYPTYRLTSAPPTPPAALQKARRIGCDAGLRHVYTGNIPGDDGENSFCHSCGKKIIGRTGFRVEALELIEGTCRYCGTPAGGVWE